jgi:hypothetical protein
VAGLLLVAGHQDVAWGAVLTRGVMIEKHPRKTVFVSLPGQMLDCSVTMYTGMTFSTERDQILAAIITGLTPKVLGEPQGWTSSRTIGISNHLGGRFCCATVRKCRSQAAGVHVSADLIHDALSVTWCRNVCVSSPGRNLKNRNADCKRPSGFSFSRFVPARKSAQIISRQ